MEIARAAQAQLEGNIENNTENQQDEAAILARQIQIYELLSNALN